MTTAQPGWYPDPRNPAAVRWYDGTGWTESTAPAPASVAPAWQQPAVAAPVGWPPAPVSAGRNTAVIILTAFVLVIGTGILAAIAIPVFLHQRAKAELSGLSSVTCESVGAEAVAASQAGVTADQVPLSSISGLVVAQDDRATVRRPAPGGQSLVLSCAGTALWQDGISTPIQVDLHIDSAVEHVVTFSWSE